MPTLNHILHAVESAAFTVLGAFYPKPGDGAPEGTATLVLVGNAGPEMWSRFSTERDPAHDEIDAWTLEVIDALAVKVGGQAVFPFNQPPLPFQRWARSCRAGFASPLGLNIHPIYGLWSAYRAALCFSELIELGPATNERHPCETCRNKPCLSACPVGAFDGRNYDVDGCAAHISQPVGTRCVEQGCTARLACPVGREFVYNSAQMTFHMRAFLKARSEEA